MNGFDISIIPDNIEKKEIKRHYFRLAWIVILLVLIFSGFTRLMAYVSAGIISEGFTPECIAEGKKVIRADPLMSSLYSYGFPIAADIAAICLGVLITKTDLKKKLSKPDMSGKEFFNTTALTFGAATVASFVNLILLMIILIASGKFPDFQNNGLSDAAKIVSGNNPMWLEFIIYFYICLLGPVLEELLFRGVLLEGLRRYGNTFGIIMSSLLFGLMHQNFIQCLPAMAIGIIWAYADIKCGSILPSIILHIINNTMSSVLTALMDSVDFSKMLEDPSKLTSDMLLGAGMSVFIVSFLFLAIRGACIICSLVIIFTYKGRIIGSSEYSKHRTWRYFFTSVPWIAVILYLAVSTVTSISLLT